MFLGINIFRALLRAHFSPRLAARAKMSLSRAQNILMPANINSIVPYYQRSLTKRQNEWMERPLPASDALFDEAADQISGRNLPFFKTVYCVSGLPHETIVFVFCFSACSCWALIWFIAGPLFLFNLFCLLCQILLEKSLWRTTYNKLRRVLRRDCVTWTRDFKFCMSQAQWRVKIFVFFKKCFALSASIFFVFPREQSI